MSATQIAMGVNFLIGATTTITSLSLMEKIKNCTDVGLQRSIRGVLVISVALVTSSIAYMICNLSCSCALQEHPLVRTILPIYFISIGIILIVLGAIIQSKAKGECKDAKRGAITIWTLGIVVMLSGMTFFFIDNKKQITAAVDNIQKQAAAREAEQARIAKAHPLARDPSP